MSVRVSTCASDSVNGHWILRLSLACRPGTAVQRIQPMRYSMNCPRVRDQAAGPATGVDVQQNGSTRILQISSFNSFSRFTAYSSLTAVNTSFMPLGGLHAENARFVECAVR